MQREKPQVQLQNCPLLLSEGSLCENTQTIVSFPINESKRASIGLEVFIPRIVASAAAISLAAFLGLPSSSEMRISGKQNVGEYCGQSWAVLLELFSNISFCFFRERFLALLLLTTGVNLLIFGAETGAVL